MSEDFKELLSSSNLNEKSREAIRIIAKGGTPTPILVARPGLIEIIRFFIETYQCTKDEFSDAMQLVIWKRSHSVALNVTRDSRVEMI